MDYVLPPAAGLEERLRPEEVHILVVDDEKGIRDLLKMAIESAPGVKGVPADHIHAAGTVDEALEIIRRYKPQFGTLDMNLKDPTGRTGIDIARAMKAEDPLARAVLVADLSRDEGQRKMKDAEMEPGGSLAGFVEKPNVVNPAVFLAGQFFRDRVEPNPAAGQRPVVRPPSAEAAGLEEVAQIARQGAAGAWEKVTVTPPTRGVMKRLLPVFYARETFHAIPLVAKSGSPFLVIAGSQVEEDGVRALLGDLKISKDQYLIQRYDLEGLDRSAALAKALQEFAHYRTYAVDPNRPAWLQDLLASLQEEGIMPIGDTAPALQATERYFQILA
ncbi:MAG: hypothetical protein HYZ93_04645 [Candidatus Omnitrophica bacterium]|nr:hypothetical protein [Candidatus Omnitrophota bacterium]